MPFPPATWRLVAAVVAHPDDESFGLGALLAAIVDAGVAVDVVCCTAGDRSTLDLPGADPSTLGLRRRAELRAAANALGVRRAVVLDHTDGGLSMPTSSLAIDVLAAIDPTVDALVVFDEGGITGHPDHEAATAAARTVADEMDVPVLAWTIPLDLAKRLNDEFGATFVGRDVGDATEQVAVDRRRQRAAIACHASQATSNAVLDRRLELAGSYELVRWLRRPP